MRSALGCCTVAFSHRHPEAVGYTCTTSTNVNVKRKALPAGRKARRVPQISRNFLSPQRGTSSQHCETADTGLVHRAVCLFARSNTFKAATQYFKTILQHRWKQYFTSSLPQCSSDATAMWWRFTNTCIIILSFFRFNLITCSFDHQLLTHFFESPCLPTTVLSPPPGVPRKL